MGLSKVDTTEGCPHIRDGLYEGFHCILGLHEPSRVGGGGGGGGGGD